jgi:hypothetical protein
VVVHRVDREQVISGDSVALPPGYHFRTSAGVGKLSPMQIRCKYGQLGPSKGQFNSPHGFCLGADEDIIVADTNNHRIQVFDKVGAYKFQFGMPGKLDAMQCTIFLMWNCLFCISKPE